MVIFFLFLFFNIIGMQLVSSVQIQGWDLGKIIICVDDKVL